MRVVSLFAVLSLCVLGTRARAQVDEERIRLMRETLAFTDVIDAVERADRFDLNARLDYERLRAAADVLRERTDAAGRRKVKVAESTRELSQLSIALDVGLYRDLMLTIRMPLILSDARVLRGGDVGALDGSPGATDPLFGSRFESPTRAGLDYLALALSYALLNQMRKSWLPTWVVRVEGRRAIGRVLSPCRSTQDQRLCGTLSSEDRDGDGALDGTRPDVASTGASRGLSALLLEMRFSRRYRRAEPYAGSGLLAQWPSTARENFPEVGGVRPRPGVQTAATLGVGITPWENRATFQRFTLDLRLEATHIGEGFDYSPLFDALGSGTDPGLARARYQGVRGSPGTGALRPCSGTDDTNCGKGAQVPFSGVTRIASHLAYGGRVALEVQAARYVRFIVGTSLNWVTPHAITGIDACSGDSGEPRGDEGEVCAGGEVDPRRRAVIDAPGYRFSLRDELWFSVFAQATAMF